MSRYQNLIFILLVFILTEAQFSQSRNQFGETTININNVSTWIFGNGQMDQNPTGNSGFIFPKGSNKAAVFQSGFVWGCKIKDYDKSDSIRVGGTTYRSGLKPGKILFDGSAQDTNDYSVRLYRVRPDYNSSPLEDEIDLQNKSYEEIRNQYELDWFEWPAEDGAPYDDVNENGKYEPEIDIPGIQGADQTIWLVLNDLDTAQCKYLYGSNPIGLEVQITLWAYNHNKFENTIFKELKIINKGNYKLDELYIGAWADMDVGDAGDDFIGCDTTLNIGYTYNGEKRDGAYRKNPPAVGYSFLRGPLVDGFAQDSALVDGNFIPFKKRLGMTRFAFIYKPYDPPLENYEGTLNMYNYLKGLTKEGERWIPPSGYGTEPTYFPTSGNPITGEGWIDGIVYDPGDRRFAISSGPIKMNPGETQSIIFAETAGGSPVMNNLEAVNDLFKRTRTIQKIKDVKHLIPSERLAPKINYTSLDSTIVIKWNDNKQNILNESFEHNDIKFQGYIVYQLDQKLSELKPENRIKVFDKKDGIKSVKIDKNNFIYGNDTGIEHEFYIDQSFLTGESLENYQKYYYAVSSYYTHNLFEDLVIELFSPVIEVIPKPSDPGDEYTNKYNDLISYEYNGSSDAHPIIKTVDPTELKSSDYRIEILEDGWKVFNITENQYADDVTIPYSKEYGGYQSSFYANGFSIKLNGDIKTTTGIDSIFADGIPLEQSKKNKKNISITDFRSEDYNNSYSNTIFGKGTLDSDKLEEDYKIVFVDELTKNYTEDQISFGSYATIIGADKYSLSDHPLNPNPGSNQPFRVKVPFQIWNTTKNKQVNLLIYDKERRLSDNLYAPFPINRAVDLYILNYDYTETVVDTSSERMSNCTWAFRIWSLNRLITENETWEPPNELVLKFNDRLIPNDDEFYFSTEGKMYSDEKAKSDVDEINIFPNPVYGFADVPSGHSRRYQTITHLPEKAKITICDLSGNVIRIINKNSTDNYYKWDLTNGKRFLVASGIYIIYIEMPDLGKTKILKSAVVQSL